MLRFMISTICALALVSCWTARPAHAQPAPGEIGVYFNAAGTQTTTCTALGTTFDLFVIANVPASTDVAGFEFQFDLDSRAFIATEILPAGWVNIRDSSLGEYMAAGPACVTGGGPVTLLQLTIFTADSAPTVPPFTFTLGGLAYSSFTPSSPGYATCDPVLTVASEQPLTIANASVEASYSGQCQIACADNWIGTSGNDFTGATDWSGGVYPLSERALLTNPTAVLNQAILAAGANESVCGITLQGPGAEQRLTLSAGSTLIVANGLDVESGGFLELQGATVQGTTTVSNGGQLEGGGTISDLVNGGVVLLNSSATLNIGNSVQNTGLFDLNVGTLYLPPAIDLLNAGVFKVTTSGTITGSVTNQSGGFFDVVAAPATITGCFDNQLGAILNVSVGATLDILGCASITNSGTLIISGTCTACRAAPVPTLIQLSGGLVSDAGSTLDLADGTLRVSGNLLVEIDDPARITLPATTIELMSTGDASFALFEVFSPDFGPAESIESANIEAIGTLALPEANSKVRLVDAIDNDGIPGIEALYVASLDMAPGCTIDLAGQVLYYASATPADPSAPGSGVNVVDTVGGGQLVALQSPTAVGPEPVPSRQLTRVVNRPNPFNPRTTIEWTMAREGRVTVTIYDIRGQRVRHLLDAERPSGLNQVLWDGRDDAGVGVSSGSYMYRVSSFGELRQGKMALIR